jgi:hypothetical protein
MGQGDHVAGRAHTLIRAIAGAEALIALRDQTGSGFITGTRQESAFPGNTAALNAVMIPHHEIRALETEIRQQVTGTTLHRGGSAANTIGALNYLAAVADGGAVPDHQATWIETCMIRWEALRYALPGMPALPQWLRDFMGPGRRDPYCPYCGHDTLHANDAVGIVACLKPACPGTTPTGTRPYATPRKTPHGDITLHWLDGTVQTHDRTTPPARPMDAGRSRELPAPNGHRRPAPPHLRPPPRHEPHQPQSVNGRPRRR